MNKSGRAIFVLIFLLSGAWMVAQDAASSPSTKAVGTVQSVSGNSFSLKTDAGVQLNVSAQDSTKVLRSEPGQKSLKEATPIQFPEIQAGDRTLVSGKGSADGASLTATTIVVMKKADVVSKQEKEKQDWQRRSVAGLVKTVDVATGTVTITVSKKDVAVHVSPTTVVRRYSPNSVKFDDATKSTLSDVKVGDQLAARGNKNPDGTDVTAEEVVSGAFPYISGMVQSVNKESNQLTVNDLTTKKPVTVTIGADSQMRKLPDMLAQGIARRLKGDTPGAQPPANGQATSGPAGTGTPPPSSGAGQGAGAGQGQGGGMRAGGRGDMFQMILSRAPAVQLSELQKGDAVMIVATEGTSSTPPTAITLLTGVEPILTASPKGEASTILSPWNLGGGGGGDATAQQ